jgi:hypothetical protein
VLEAPIKGELVKRYLKMLGLATGMAIALMGLIGASTAWATAIYNGATKIGVGSETKWSVSAGTSVKLMTTEGTVLNTCTEGTISGNVVSAGGAAETVRGSFSAANVKWSGCNNTVSTLAGGETELHYISGLNGTVIAKGFEVTLQTPFGSCVYSAGPGTHMGTLTGSTTSNATMDISAVLARKTGLCPSSAKMVATGTLTSQSPYHVTAS